MSPTASKRWDDLDALMLPFRARVVALLGRLAALDFRPLLWETYRSPERAQLLVREGKSLARGGLSMHCYGVAADIICAEHRWGCEERDEHGKRKHDCNFFRVLGEQAKACGLAWGGDWDGDGDQHDQKLIDMPHVQGVPLELQDRIRAAQSHDERERILLAGLRPMVP